MEKNNPPSVVLFFIDGLGLGDAGEDNPLSLLDSIEPLNNLKNSADAVIDGGILTPTDPRLGIEGRPQSASGQTTILTGINAPQLLGHHKQGFPNERLREVIAEHSIFLQLKEAGHRGDSFRQCLHTAVFFGKTSLEIRYDLRGRSRRNAVSPPF